MALAVLLALPGCPVEDSPAPATIEISPAEGLAGTTFPVTVRGTNTHFSLATFTARFGGRGVRVQEHDGRPGIRVSGETAARLEVTIDEDATAGPRTLRIDAPPDSFVANLQVRVPGEEPSLTIDPRLGGPSSELDLTLRGRATHFEDGVTAVLFPELAGVTVLSVAATTPTLASARIRIAPEAPAGVAPVAVVTGDELVVASFEVVTEARAAVSVEPPEGYSGRAVDVVVTGARADFGEDADQVSVAFEAGAGVAVSELTIASRTRLSARFTIAEAARAGFRRFTVRVDPADPEQEAREFAGSFSVRAPGSPSVRVLPPYVHRGQTATLWLEGRGTSFDAALAVRPEDDSGVELAGRWVLGPAGAALRFRVADDAPLGTTTVSADDGVTDDLTAPFEVLDADPSILQASPAVVETGASAVEVTLGSSAPSFTADLTRAQAAPRSGIAVRDLEILDPRTAVVTLDVLQTAPAGTSSLTLTTGTETVSTASLTVAPASGRGSITVEPPVLRAGTGPIDLVVTPHEVTLGAGLSAEVSDPAFGVPRVVGDAEAEQVNVSVDVLRAATAGTAVLVIADGSNRFGTQLQVLPAAEPSVQAAPSALLAGRAGQLVVAFGQGTSWLPDVTVAAAPVARGLSVDGLTVIDRTTAILEITVSSEAPTGPSGIVMATHGEVSVVPLQIEPPAATPSLTLDPPSVEPGQSATITLRGVNVDLSEGPVLVDFPESPEIRVVGSLVLDPETVEVQVEVDAGVEPGTRPCELEAPGIIVRAGLAVRSPGTPAVWIEPSRIRRGRTTRIEARVDGLDLPAGPVTVTADQPEVIVGEVLVGEPADRASVDLTIPSGAAFESFGLTITAGAAEAHHLLLVGAALPLASTGGATAEAGATGYELVVAGEDTTFAPEETLALPGAGGAALRLGALIVGSPGQLRAPVDVSAAAEVDLAEVAFVTGSELVVASLGVRGSDRVAFDSPGEVRGNILPDRGALLAFSGAPAVLNVLRAEPDVPEIELAMTVLGRDGFSPLAGPATDPAALLLALPEDALVRVFAPAPIEGADPLGFSFSSSPLVPDAAQELEPNDELVSAELFPDPVECRDPDSCPDLAPTFMTCSFDPSGDRDVFVVPASAPVAFELFARRLVAGSRGADAGMRAPWDAPLVSPVLGADLVAILEPGGPGDDATVALEGLAGSAGEYLVVVRSAVVVDELGWTEPGGYVELRAAPGISLDGFTVEVVGAVGQVLLPEVDLGPAVADATGLVLVSALEGADIVAPGLALPEDGAVVVRWQGLTVDAVAFGASIHWEGTPVDLGGALAVGRRLGIDRNDNAADFAAREPSPGSE